METILIEGGFESTARILTCECVTDARNYETEVELCFYDVGKPNGVYSRWFCVRTGEALDVAAREANGILAHKKARLPEGAAGEIRSNAQRALSRSLR